VSETKRSNRQCPGFLITRRSCIEPHNPTGSVLSAESADYIRDIAVENDLLVLSDEIYEKIVYGSTHRSIASVDGMFERTITINGLSKVYPMTGWRLGYLGAPRDLLDPLIRMRQYDHNLCVVDLAARGRPGV